MQSNDMFFSRRRFLIFSGAVALAPTTVAALSDATARKLVNAIVADINRVISSRKSVSAMIAEFEGIFARYADVEIIARSTLGADARRATAAQLAAFTKAFRGYISRKYGKRFKEFEGGRIEVNEVRQVKSFYEVKTTAYLPGEAPFEVKFLVSGQSGRDLFFDMITEGISLRLTERAEIGAMLDRRRGDINALIQDISRAG